MTPDSETGKVHIVKVTSYKTIVPHPFVKWYRHPVWWWKMRFLRQDIRYLEKHESPLAARMRHEIERREYETFLIGKDLSHGRD